MEKQPPNGFRKAIPWFVSVLIFTATVAYYAGAHFVHSRLETDVEIMKERQQQMKSNDDEMKRKLEKCYAG